MANRARRSNCPCATGCGSIGYWRFAVACIVIVGLIAGLLYWLLFGDYESTDDAFIAARSFSIAPKVGGYITDVPVTDNQHVAAGELLAKVDDRDYKIAVDQAKAQVAVAEANITNINAQIDSQQEQIKQAKAQVDQAEAQLQFAQQEEARAKDLVDKGAGTVQREQQTHSDLQSQQANEARTKAALTAAELGIKSLRHSSKARAPRSSKRMHSSATPILISIHACHRGPVRARGQAVWRRGARSQLRARA